MRVAIRPRRDDKSSVKIPEGMVTPYRLQKSTENRKEMTRSEAESTRQRQLGPVQQRDVGERGGHGSLTTIR
ncbi:hypothetical protein PZA11_007151 [Diplocarpon coronariae]